MSVQIETDLEQFNTVQGLVKSNHIQVSSDPFVPTDIRKTTVDLDMNSNAGSDYEFLANSKKMKDPVREPSPPSSPPLAPESVARSSAPPSEYDRQDRQDRQDRNDRYSPQYEPDQQVNFFESNLFSRRTNAMSEDDIRREKSFLLHEFENKNKDNMYSPKSFNMEDSLEDIKNELEFITARREMENSSIMWKRGMLLFVDSVVSVNNTWYNPFDVDLTDWSKEMHWSVFREGKFDEVIEELVRKWRGKLSMSPEMNLIMMMGSSLAFGVMAKKREKAVLDKQKEDERRMQERIKMQVREEMSRFQQQPQQPPQQYQQQPPQQPQYQQPPQQQPQYQQPQYQQPPQQQYQHQSRSPPQSPVIPIQQFTGPSITEDDMLRFTSQFIDSDSESSFGGSSVSSIGSEISTISVVPVAPVGKKPRAPRKPKVKVDKSDKTDKPVKKRVPKSTVGVITLDL